MRFNNIIITFLLLMTVHINAMGNDTCDFGTISQDTTLMWDGELPMYTPACKINFKTTKRMYLTMEFNGDCSHDFTNVQNSFVELDGSKEIRKEVVSKILDDGNGGTSDNNNREYGMNFAVGNPFKVYSYLGDIAKSEENTVSVEMPKSENLIDIHTHPSGTIIPNLRPAPSEQDIRNGNEHSNSYVISMSNQTVYIYNKHGILTYFPLKLYTK